MKSIAEWACWVLLAVASVCAATSLTSTNHVSAEAASFYIPATKTSIPKFPAKQDVLLRYRDTSNQDAIRQHAWDLFAGLVFTSDHHPQWSNWPLASDVTASLKNCGDINGAKAAPEPSLTEPPSTPLTKHARFIRALEIPHQLFVGEHTIVDSNSKELAEIHYSPELLASARRLIKSTGQCSMQNALSILLPNASKEPVQFDRRAVAIKTIWELVPGPPAGSSTVPGIHIWDSANQTLVAPDRLNEVRTWSSKIDIDIAAKCDPTSSYANSPVPLACFYSVDLDDIDTSELPVKIDIDNENQQIGVHPYHLILLGFHVMTREIPNWTWQTFYWSNQAFGKDADLQKGNPWAAGHDPRWSHYVMNATLGDPHGSTSSAPPRNVYNPYLEGVAMHGMVTDCMSCHQYAVYHSTPDIDTGYNNAQQPKGDVKQCSTTSYCRRGLKTSFLWKLAEINAPAAAATPSHALHTKTQSPHSTKAPPH